MRHSNPYFEQGNIHLKKKEFHRAIEQYRQALRLEPDSPLSTPRSVGRITM
jgi:Tfp pilus assembly protein PilF